MTEMTELCTNCGHPMELGAIVQTEDMQAGSPVTDLRKF